MSIESGTRLNLKPPSRFEPNDHYGFTRANLDDGWTACGTGVNGTFHDSSGHPLVNLTRFPDLHKMNAYGVSKGIQVGWYLNPCSCPETGWSEGNTSASAKKNPALVKGVGMGKPIFKSE